MKKKKRHKDEKNNVFFDVSVITFIRPFIAFSWYSNACFSCIKANKQQQNKTSKISYESRTIYGNTKEKRHNNLAMHTMTLYTIHIQKNCMKQLQQQKRGDQPTK